ncbi:hypothetical protein [Frigidibacter sp. SD6-1]|uniref:hypothetical protein n=1 Tax=Frigidibacter sp. SD6-1 TaxID=3032581 RepID=UPI0024DFE495|nr:hypothetical protein [Frigidibacter sp. SD6-1]
MLALLACDALRPKARTWLQDKLWSNRDRDQGAASLRQVLSQLRRDLGPNADILQIGRTRVALDPVRIDVIADPGNGRREFLEGMDVRDPEFESWLSSERSAFARPTPEPGGAVGSAAGRAADGALAAPGFAAPDRTRVVHLLAHTSRDGPERLFETLFIDCLERSLSETLVAEIYRHPPLVDQPAQIVVAVQAYMAGPGEIGLRLAVEEGATRRAVWSGRRIVRMNGAPPVDHLDILSFVTETTEAVADALVLRVRRQCETADAAVLGRIAVRKIFSMRPAEVAQADVLLAQAYALDPRAVFLAWRVQLRVIQRMERHIPEDDIEHDGLVRLISEALDLEPTNSLVLSAAANSMVLVEDDLPAGVDLARRSLALNTANPFAWDCLSIALLMDGKAEEAHRLQMRACTLAARSPIRHFWDMGACLTSVVTGRHDAALRLAQAASVMVPDFRPPLRYMAALHAARGEADRAATALERLGRAEADFSLDRMLEDRSYPVAALRRSGLLSNHRLRDLL